MRNYQYYEFQAIDKPLDRKAIAEMQNVSAIAQVTATSFLIENNDVPFKGDPLKLMEQFYDGFVNVTNTGTRELLLKVPRKTVNWGLIVQYSISEFATAYPKGDDVIFEFTSESRVQDSEQGEGWLSSLISLRSDLMQGDYRCLYLGWLYGVQKGDFEDDDLEPPVPDDLNNLNSALNRFVAFMKIDAELLAVATAKSNPAKQVIDEDALDAWINGIPEEEKSGIIKEFMLAPDPDLGNQLLQEFKKETGDESFEATESPRTVGELLSGVKE